MASEFRTSSVLAARNNSPTGRAVAGIPAYVARYGVPTFKIFMSNWGGEGTRLGLPDIDDGFLFRLAEAAAANGDMVCPHPENIEVSWVLRDRLKAVAPEGSGGLHTCRIAHSA